MNIELEEPFKSRWRLGYLRINSEGRRVVDLYNSEIDRTTTSYARYIYTVYLGYDIPPGYEVDHIDNDKTNDCLWNLQLLTEKENIEKEKARAAEECIFYGHRCTYCNDQFVLDSSEQNKRLSTSKTGLAFCSKYCSANFSVENSSASIVKSLSFEDIAKIKHLFFLGYTFYKIRKETGFSHVTIKKYCE